MSDLRLTALLLLLPAPAAAAVQHATGGPGDGAFQPHVEPASDEAADALARFEVPDGFTVELFAAEPHLANPVCFTIDERGRFFVGETFRHFAGVTDIREHMDWLDDDLSCKTVDDRVAMFRKYEGDRFHENYEVAYEQVRLVEDTDGDGIADRSGIFAADFDHPAAGIGAGLLARKGSVYYTCIPDLWLLTDADGDGVAEEKRVLSTGYGVRVALLGHDLHGLQMGPDGLLYFSVGDRGFHVETEGRVLAHPHTGAVLRCEPDGSGLEVFATGLRNPQELVFDDRGDLFTGDNNSDGGDKARWVWVLEGGDCGWRQSYQWITEPNLRGPWNAEKLWHPPHAGQPAYVNPPIANITSGPSGLAYYPGTGWGDRWRGTFFLCDFRGNPTYSGVHTFKNREKGAGFELVDAGRILWNSLVTDVDFGPEGGLYVTDWVNGWNKTGKGRIYRVTPDAHRGDRRAAETRELIAQGMEERADEELAALLGHADQRVRREAQFELAARGPDAQALLLESARHAHVPLARLHSLWALGQLARAHGISLEPVVALLVDADSEVRCQAARVLGDAGEEAAAEALTAQLTDSVPRARLFAAIALGKLERKESIGPLLDLVAEADDEDPWLRTAGVVALDTLGAPEELFRHAADESAAVRRAVLVVMRRWRRPEVARFLDDADPSVAAEAARAIYDVPITPALEALAQRLERPMPEDAYFMRRAIGANRRLGGERRARRIAAWLQKGEGTEHVREEALHILARWASPLTRDPITGEVWPVERSGGASFLAELTSELELACTAAHSDRVTIAWIGLAKAARANRAASTLFELFEPEGGRSSRVRRAALLALAGGGLAGFEDAVGRALADDDDRVRGAAFECLERFEPAEALRWIDPALEADAAVVQQSAFRALSKIAGPDADERVVAWVERLARGEAPAHAALEILDAAEGRAAEPVRSALARYLARDPDDHLAAWRACIEGGDARAGRKVFREKAAVSCLRCHKFGDEGGSEAGPALDDVGSRLSRAELVESIVLPNQEIADAFQSWILALDDDSLVVGRIVEEDAMALAVETKEGDELVVYEIDAASVVARKRDKSSMPEDLREHLTRTELRDLVEFLAGLTGPD